MCFNPSNRSFPSKIQYSRYMGHILYWTVLWGLVSSSAKIYPIWLVMLCCAIMPDKDEDWSLVCLRSPDPPVWPNPAYRRYFGWGSLQQPGIQIRGRKYIPLLPHSIQPLENTSDFSYKRTKVIHNLSWTRFQFAVPIHAHLSQMVCRVGGLCMFSMGRLPPSA